MKKSEVAEHFVWTDPVLDDQGREVISPVTLVAVADLRPVSMQERVQRYMRLPSFVQDQTDLREFWTDDDLDELPDPDEVPMSEFEDRAREISARVQARRAKESAEASQRKAEEDAAEFERWSAKYEELRQRGSSAKPEPIPPLPSGEFEE